MLTTHHNRQLPYTPIEECARRYLFNSPLYILSWLVVIMFSQILRKSQTFFTLTVWILTPFGSWPCPFITLYQSLANRQLTLNVLVGMALDTRFCCPQRHLSDVVSVEFYILHNSKRFVECMFSHRKSSECTILVSFLKFCCKCTNSLKISNSCHKDVICAGYRWKLVQFGRGWHTEGGRNQILLVFLRPNHIAKRQGMNQNEQLLKCWRSGITKGAHLLSLMSQVVVGFIFKPFRLLQMQAQQHSRCEPMKHKFRVFSEPSAVLYSQMCVRVPIQMSRIRLWSCASNMLADWTNSRASVRYQRWRGMGLLWKKSR